MRTIPTRKADEPFDPEQLKAAEAALRTLPVADEGGRAYLETHITRLARTLALVPQPGPTGRVLELGCYGQITPFLQRLCGYREVRGAYYGPNGRVDRKSIEFPDGRFDFSVDLFNADLEPFPYPDGHFDLVIAGEIIEHLLHDPMHLLLESRRVLMEGGTVLLSTPNTASVTSVAKVLNADDNPQIYPYYQRTLPGAQLEIGHMREYTVPEIGQLMKAAGLEVRALFTTFNPEYEHHRHFLRFLESNGFSTENRGEQIWCLAVKRSALPVDRYPAFLYR